MQILLNVFGIRKYLFPQGRPPSDESLEVAFPENLQIFAVFENFWFRQVEVTPPEWDINNTSYR